MKLLFELSGENPTLPFAELACVGTILEERLQVAVVNCPHPENAQRLAMTQVVLEYLGESEPSIPAFKNLLKELAITTTSTFAGRAKKVHGGCHEHNPSSQQEFERVIGDMISGPVSLNNPVTEYRAILSEDKCYFGKVLFSINRSGYDARNPGKRDFFHPGVMMPRMARTLANIAGVQNGYRVLDPFCGTGGILIEAELLGATPIGSDFDPLMVKGSRQNVMQSSLMLADATCLPFQDHSIDSVVTDLPYGQSVCIKKADTMDNLYADALDEIGRVLKRGRRAVVVTHRDISGIARQHMTVLQQHEQRVHKSLTRRVLVLGH
ncbi:MAG: methyltransferase domain-containing protein [Methanoregula sp.]